MLNEKTPFMCDGKTEYLTREEIEFQKKHTEGEYRDFFFGPDEKMIKIDWSKRVNGKIVKGTSIYMRIQ